MPDKIALVDLDGTLADYDTAMRRDLALIQGPDEEYCLKSNGSFFDNDSTPQHIRERMRLIKRQPGWWANLPRNPVGFDILDMLKAIGFCIHICTKGPLHTDSAWTEKLIWCKRELDDFDITITTKKAVVYGRVLVDDYIEYADAWLSKRPRGIVIMPLKPEEPISDQVKASPHRERIHTFAGSADSASRKSDILRRLLEAYER